MKWYAIKGNIQVDCVVQVQTKSFHPDRTMKEWAFVYISSGQRTLHVCDEDLFIKPGEYFILPPNLPHHGLYEDTHEAYYVHFFANCVEAPAPRRVNAGEICLPLYGKMPNNISCDQILDYTARHCLSPYRNVDFLNSQVQAVLYQVSYFHQRNALRNTKSTDLTEGVLRFIQDNYSKPLSAGDYESRFKKSYRQLNDLFFCQYGTTIKQMQITVRINQSKRMLVAGYSIAETSQKCGFDDYLYFLKVFHKIVGITPKTYQEQLLTEHIPQ